MPFKTKYGSHYHETQFCCGASIPCSSTEGLSPCSLCCGKSAKGGSAGGTGGGPSSASGAGAAFAAASGDDPQVVVGSYAMPDGGGISDAMADNIRAATGGMDPSAFVKEDGTYTLVDMRGNKATLHPDGRVELSKGSGIEVELISDEPVEGPVADDAAGLPAKGESSASTEDERSKQLDDMVKWWAETHGPGKPFDPVREQLHARAAEASVAERVSESKDVPTPLATMENASDTAHDLLESSPFRKELLDKAKSLAKIGAKAGVPGAGLFLPVLDVVGKIPVSALRGLHIVSQDMRNRISHSRSVRCMMRKERCDRFTAECLCAWAREKQLKAAQSASASIIKEDLIVKSATNPSISVDDIVFEDVFNISARLRSGRWIVNEKLYKPHQTLALARVLQQRLEQEGYGDKVTPDILRRMRDEEGLAPGEESAATLALRGLMAEHDFRVGTAKRAARRWSRMKAAKSKQVPVSSVEPAATAS